MVAFVFSFVKLMVRVPIKKTAKTDAMVKEILYSKIYIEKIRIPNKISDIKNADFLKIRILKFRA